jgi:hypothetical protein
VATFLRKLTFGFPPHVAELQHGGWRIRLTAVPEFKEIFKRVSETGGYAFTHLGSLERADGSLFSAQDADAVLGALRRFLSFARGVASSLPVRWGTAGDGSIVWEQWGAQPVDPWTGRDTWFDEHHGNLLSELFDAFAQIKADTDLGPPFSLALHWFQNSNIRAGGMEGAIILGLTALDLLGAMVVVDRAGVMSDSEYDKLVAKDKTRQAVPDTEGAERHPGEAHEPLCLRCDKQLVAGIRNAGGDSARLRAFKQEAAAGCSVRPEPRDVRGVATLALVPGARASVSTRTPWRISQSIDGRMARSGGERPLGVERAQKAASVHVRRRHPGCQRLNGKRTAQWRRLPESAINSISIEPPSRARRWIHRRKCMMLRARSRRLLRGASDDIRWFA